MCCLDQFCLCLIVLIQFYSLKFRCLFVVYTGLVLVVGVGSVALDCLDMVGCASVVCCFSLFGFNCFRAVLLRCLVDSLICYCVGSACCLFVWFVALLILFGFICFADVQVCLLLFCVIVCQFAVCWFVIFYYFVVVVLSVCLVVACL